MFTVTIIDLVVNIIVFTFLGFSLGMLYNSRKMRKVSRKVNVLLNEISELELQQKDLPEISDEDKVKKVQFLIEKRIKLEYIKGRLDVMGEFLD